MIFGRKKSKAKAEAAAAAVEEAVATTPEAAEVAPEPAEQLSEAETKAREWDAAFDREAGPFDIGEVDLEADEHEVKRIDLGSLVITPFPGMTMQLQVNRESNQVQSILVGDGASGLEVAVFAGPAKSSMAGEIREEVIKATQQQKGQIALVNGPFGTEIRRAVPVTDQEGKAATHVSRTWLVSGPGWLLRGVLLGKATFEPQNEEAQLALLEFFSNLVVRRDSAPAAPGSLLTMTVPQAEG